MTAETSRVMIKSNARERVERGVHSSAPCGLLYFRLAGADGHCRASPRPFPSMRHLAKLPAVGSPCL